MKNKFSFALLDVFLPRIFSGLSNADVKGLLSYWMMNKWIHSTKIMPDIWWWLIPFTTVIKWIKTSLALFIFGFYFIIDAWEFHVSDYFMSKNFVRRIIKEILFTLIISMLSCDKHIKAHWNVCEDQRNLFRNIYVITKNASIGIFARIYKIKIETLHRLNQAVIFGT